MSMMTLRHALSTWGEQHADKEVREIVPEHMAHSRAVTRANYVHDEGSSRAYK